MNGKPGIHGLHHTAVATDVFDASLNFYCDLLGFTVAMTWMAENGYMGRIAYLDSGNGNSLELFEQITPVERIDTGRTARSGELMHLCLVVDDVDALTEEARVFGCEILTPAYDQDLLDTTGYGLVTARVSFMRGPAGEVVEFVSGLPSAITGV